MARTRSSLQGKAKDGATVVNGDGDSDVDAPDGVDKEQDGSGKVSTGTRRRSGRIRGVASATQQETKKKDKDHTNTKKGRGKRRSSSRLAKESAKSNASSQDDQDDSQDGHDGSATTADQERHDQNQPQTETNANEDSDNEAKSKGNSDGDGDEGDDTVTSDLPVRRDTRRALSMPGSSSLASSIVTTATNPINAQPQHQPPQQDRPAITDPRLVLSRRFLDEDKTASGLARRLDYIVAVVQDIESGVNLNDLYPSINGLCHALIKHLSHPDKQVRLNTVLACMELISVYAPFSPWDKQETLAIFRQTIRQLANLSVQKQLRQPSNFERYLCILELLAKVKIGAIVVEIAEGAGDDLLDDMSSHGSDDDNDDDDDNNDNDTVNEKGTATISRNNRSTRKKTSGKTSERHTSLADEALQILCDLVHTMLHAVQLDHPANVSIYIQEAICACVKEYHEGVLLPIPLLDELLLCIGQGPEVLVLNPKLQIADHHEPKAKPGEGQGQAQSRQLQLAQIKKLVPRANPSYLVAAMVLRKSMDRLSEPIAALINGLLNGDDHVVAKSKITTESLHAIGVARSEDRSAVSDIWGVIYELRRVAPSMLTTVMGNITSKLPDPILKRRLLITKLLGKLFLMPPQQGSSVSFVEQFRPCYRDWLRRAKDKEVEIRLTMVRYVINMVHQSTMSTHASVAERSQIRKEGQLEAGHVARPTMMTQDEDVGTQENDGTKGKGAIDGGEAEDVDVEESREGQGQLQVADVEMDIDIDIQELSIETITKSFLVDTDADVRMQTVLMICDLFHSNPNALPTQVLQATANRVMSKHKEERRRTLTGLGNLYLRHFIRPNLREVEKHGDDCDIGHISDAIHHCIYEYDQPLVERFRWIPSKVFECAFYSDAVDSAMHSRVYRVVDEMLLGSDAPKSTTRMSATTRATGLAMIVASIQPDIKSILTGDDQPTLPCRWMLHLFQTRSKLQKMVRRYVETRRRMGDLPINSEERMVASTEAMEALESVAKLTAAPGGGIPDGKQQHPVLEAFHGAKDRKIVQLLSAIATPLHTVEDGVKVISELPQRLKSQGNAVATWAETLARRCAMSSFMNAQMVYHCVLLALEACREEDSVLCGLFLACVKVAVTHFPELCATKQCFKTIVELFCEARSAETEQFKKDMDYAGIITCLSSILAQAAPARRTLQQQQQNKPGNAKSYATQILDADVEEQLLELCTRDGTPYQARHAVSTMAALINPESSSLTQAQHDAFLPLLTELASPAKLNCDHDHDNSSNTAKSSQSAKLISVLASLAELATCASSVFSEPEGQRALSFAINLVKSGGRNGDSAQANHYTTHQGTDLMDVESKHSSGDVDKADAGGVGNKKGGNEGGIDADEKEEGHNSENESRRSRTSPSRKRRSKQTTKTKTKTKGRSSTSSRLSSTPNAYTHIHMLEDTTLSIPCRVVCAAIEFLVCYISSFMRSGSTACALASKHGTDDEADENDNNRHTDANTNAANQTGKSDPAKTRRAVAQPPSITNDVFQMLSDIMRDEGCVSSSQPSPPLPAQSAATSPHHQPGAALISKPGDRSALRECAALSMIRLCDSSLYLESKFLTIARWHTLAAMFLDDDRDVRARVMDELSMMLAGRGSYACVSGPQVAPSLRFLSLLVLCVDGDHGTHHAASNGGAANVGRKVHELKADATTCIKQLRVLFKMSSVRYESMGPKAMKHFQAKLQNKIMPEYAMPYAFHLLAYRAETPYAGAAALSKSTGLTQASQSDAMIAMDEGQHRTLRKRLRMILDPLIESLGDSADNLSFLMRLTELTAKHFSPSFGDQPPMMVEIAAQHASPNHGNASPSGQKNRSLSRADVNDAKDVANARLKIVCAAAREVLLSHVKMDGNFVDHPGRIVFPPTYFSINSEYRLRRKRRLETLKDGEGRRQSEEKLERKRRRSERKSREKNRQTDDAGRTADASTNVGGDVAGVESGKDQRGEQRPQSSSEVDSPSFQDPSTPTRRRSGTSHSDGQTHQNALLSQSTGNEDVASEIPIPPPDSPTVDNVHADTLADADASMGGLGDLGDDEAEAGSNVTGGAEIDDALMDMSPIAKVRSPLSRNANSDGNASVPTRGATPPSYMNGMAMSSGASRASTAGPHVARSQSQTQTQTQRDAASDSQTQTQVFTQSQTQPNNNNNNKRGADGLTKPAENGHQGNNRKANARAIENGKAPTNFTTSQQNGRNANNRDRNTDVAVTNGDQSRREDQQKRASGSSGRRARAQPSTPTRGTATSPQRSPSRPKDRSSRKRSHDRPIPTIIQITREKLSTDADDKEKLGKNRHRNQSDDVIPTTLSIKRTLRPRRQRQVKASQESSSSVPTLLDDSRVDGGSKRRSGKQSSGMGANYEDGNDDDNMSFDVGESKEPKRRRTNPRRKSTKRTPTRRRS